MFKLQSVQRGGMGWNVMLLITLDESEEENRTVRKSKSSLGNESVRTRKCYARSNRVISDVIYLRMTSVRKKMRGKLRHDEPKQRK